jgi:hypothetical protein
VCRARASHWCANGFTAHLRAKARTQTPAGVIAISRGLSAATPPESARIIWSRPRQGSQQVGVCLRRIMSGDDSVRELVMAIEIGFVPSLGDEVAFQPQRGGIRWLRARQPWVAIGKNDLALNGRDSHVATIASPTWNLAPVRPVGSSPEQMSHAICDSNRLCVAYFTALPPKKDRLALARHTLLILPRWRFGLVLSIPAQQPIGRATEKVRAQQ